MQSEGHQETAYGSCKWQSAMEEVTGSELILPHSSPAVVSHEAEDVTNSIIVPPLHYPDGYQNGAAPLAAASTPFVGMTVADVAELLLGPTDTHGASSLVTGTQQSGPYPVTGSVPPSISDRVPVPDASGSEDGFWESLWALASRSGSNDEAQGDALEDVSRVPVASCQLPAAVQGQGRWSQGTVQAQAAAGYNTLVQLPSSQGDRNGGNEDNKDSSMHTDPGLPWNSLGVDLPDRSARNSPAEGKAKGSGRGENLSSGGLDLRWAGPESGPAQGEDGTLHARASTSALTREGHSSGSSTSPSQAQTSSSMTVLEQASGKFPTALKGKVSKLSTLGEELWSHGITLGVEMFLPGSRNCMGPDPRGPLGPGTSGSLSVAPSQSGRRPWPWARAREPSQCDISGLGPPAWAATVGGHEAAAGHSAWGGRALPSAGAPAAAQHPDSLSASDTVAMPPGIAPMLVHAHGAAPAGNMLGAVPAERTAARGNQSSKGLTAPESASGVVPDCASALSLADRLAATIQGLRSKSRGSHRTPASPSLGPRAGGSLPHPWQAPTGSLPGPGVGGGGLDQPLLLRASQHLAGPEQGLGSTSLTPARTMKRAPNDSWPRLAGRVVHGTRGGGRDHRWGAGPPGLPVPHTSGHVQAQAWEGFAGESSVPRLPGAAGQKLLLLRVLFIEAAQALKRGDKDAFRNLASVLKPHGKKSGDWCERVVYCVLRSLTLRAQGSAYATLKKQGRLTIQEMEEAIVWNYTANPTYPFVSFATTGIVVPKLLGHAHVHLVTMGLTAPPMISTIMKLLATQNIRGKGNNHSEGGDQRTVLRSFRVTSLRGNALARGHARSEFETLQNHGQVARVLRSVATSLGIEFSFDGIFLKENSLRLFDEVVRRPGEVVAVCIPFDFKLFGEDLGPYGSPLEHLGRFLQRIQPEVVTVAEENVAANGPDFVARVANVLDFMWLSFHSDDVVAGFADLKHMYNLEQQYWNTICCSVVGCEGEERRWRPTSMEQREYQFRAWGFVPLKVPEMLVESLKDMTTGPYPEEFGVSVREFDLCGTWMGHRLLGVQSWTC